MNPVHVNWRVGTSTAIVNPNYRQTFKLIYVASSLEVNRQPLRHPMLGELR